MTRLAIVLPILFFAFTITAYADEALLEESSGTLAPVNGESTSIRMVSERVVIELGDTSYTVDASFEFLNEGETVTLPVGFPDAGYGYAGPFKGIPDNDSFETWVNGDPCSFRKVPGEMVLRSNENPAREVVITDPDSIAAAHAMLQRGGAPTYKGVTAMTCDETFWHVKDVTFPAGAVTRTRVRYSASNGVQGWTYLEYIIGTGRTWKSTIGRAVFVVKPTPAVWMQAVPMFSRDGYWPNERTYVKNRPGEYEHEYILTDVEPYEDEVFRVMVKDTWSKKPEAPWESMEWVSFLYLYKDKLASDDFLDILSLEQLRLFRNVFYAIHGKVFTDPELDAYFRNTYWYKPRADYSDSDLTESDHVNIRKIIEKERWLKELIGGK